MFYNVTFDDDDILCVIFTVFAQSSCLYIIDFDLRT